MNKLKNKVFFTIYIIMTISVLVFIIVINAQKYVEQVSSIENSLNTLLDVGQKDNSNPNVPPNNDSEGMEAPKENDVKFMDTVMYTILIDDNNNIKEIVNNSNGNIDTEKITSIGEEILSENNISNKHIGLLYIEDYSYFYSAGDKLVIYDNSTIRASLLKTLYISVIIFILTEIVIVIASKMITNWIIKPVVDAFNKQKQFIADASHELKTPLSVIVASSEALSDYPNEKKWLTNIKMEAERMNNLITSLLDLAKSENVPREKFTVGNLSKVIELAVLTFEGRAYESSLKLKYDIDENIQFKMDEGEMRELAEILLDNAVKHSYKKENIEISLKQNKDNIILLVKNVGDEIPKGEEEKIFERFYRVDKSRSRKENRYGLGLAIAKNIVTNHGGKISAASLNNVTTFKVVFKK